MNPKCLFSGLFLLLALALIPLTGTAASPAQQTGPQADLQTSHPDQALSDAQDLAPATVDPLTEAGRWELFGRGVLNDVFFVDSSYGWAAGTGVWKTTDGGATWRRIPVLAGTTLVRLVFADRNRGWALGHDHRILRTSDGGATWLVAQAGSTEYPPFLLEYQTPDDLWSGGNFRSVSWDSFDRGYWTHSTDGGSHVDRGESQRHH